MLLMGDRQLAPAAPARTDGAEPPVANTSAAAQGDAASRADRGDAATRDRVDHDRHKPAVLDYLRHAQRKSGRRPMDLAREFLRLNRGRGKLSLSEYVQYGVYDRTCLSPEDQARFITNNLHWPITHACCDMTWQATTEDKWLCAQILAQSSIAVPETLAVIDKTERIYAGTRKISTAQQLREFVTAGDVLPVFGKENRGICSFGAFLILEADDSTILLKEHGRLSYEACMDEFVGATSYLLQRTVRNHGFFDRHAESLATVRVCVLVSENDVRIPFAVLKLPSRGNVADSFWRPGNLACNVDVESGRVLTMRTKDPLGTTDHLIHPETGAMLVGEILPMWDRVLDLACACAPIFQPVRYQSMDIAITPDGPVLIEINTGGGFDLPQLASGKGFLTDEVRDFFRCCGYARL